MPNQSAKKPIIYAFIDSQNLNLGTSKDLYRNKKKIYQGWKLDFEKFRIYLKDRFKVKKAILFIGYLKDNNKLYNALRRYGYNLVFKPTVLDNFGKPKGNVDAELVLHCAAIEYPNFDKSIIVSGDGDFYCLLEYLERENKMGYLIIPNRKNSSKLLNRFQDNKIFLIRDKDKLELKRK